jgi:hypothetical protein
MLRRPSPLWARALLWLAPVIALPLAGCVSARRVFIELVRLDLLVAPFAFVQGMLDAATGAN